MKPKNITKNKPYKPNDSVIKANKHKNDLSILLLCLILNRLIMKTIPTKIISENIIINNNLSLNK